MRKYELGPNVENWVFIFCTEEVSFVKLNSHMTSWRGLILQSWSQDHQKWVGLLKHLTWNSYTTFSTIQTFAASIFPIWALFPLSLLVLGSAEVKTTAYMQPSLIQIDITQLEFQKNIPLLDNWEKHFNVKTATHSIQELVWPSRDLNQSLHVFKDLLRMRSFLRFFC